MSIEDKVAAWLNSSASAAARGAAVYDDVVEEAQRLRSLLFDSLPDSLKPMGIDVFRLQTPRWENNGYVVDILVDAAKVRRESLVPSKYPEGVENIIEQFNRGWETGFLKNSNRHKMVRGVWHGELHWSRPVYPQPGRSPEDQIVHFLENAIENFIATSKFHPTVTLNPKYTSRNTEEEYEE